MKRSRGRSCQPPQLLQAAHRHGPSSGKRDPSSSSHVLRSAKQIEQSKVPFYFNLFYGSGPNPPEAQGAYRILVAFRPGAASQRQAGSKIKLYLAYV